MFEGVMNGIPVGFPDFMLPLNRNGFLENCYFDFSYSPIRMENGEVGGVLVTVIETTNKKRAEDELKESEEKFKAMADNIPNLAWMANAEGWIYWYNKKWYEYTGTTAGEMEGWGWQSVHDPLELPRVLDNWKNSISTGEAFEMVFPLKGIDGKFRQFLTRVLPVRNDKGEIINWFGSNTDITLQKETEEALKESKNELEFVIEAAQLGTFDYNPLTNKFSANSRLKEWFGLPPNEQVDLTDTIHAIAEKDKSNVTNAIRRALNYSSGGIYDVEYTIINLVTKTEVIVHAKGRAWFNNDKIAYRLNGTLEDVTEQTKARRKTEQSDQQFRNMVLEAPIGICIMDASTTVSEIVNERFIEIAGKPIEIILGKKYWDTFSEARIYYESALNDVIKTGIPYYANEVPVMLVRHGREEIIHITFVYAPVKNEEGEVSKVAVWVVDNTMQVKARQKIAESENNLKLMILQAPVAIAIMRGEDYVVEIANKYALELWRRTVQQVLNKPVFDSMPELLTQGIKELLDEVRNTGVRFATAELPVQFLKNGSTETAYVNFSYEPLYDADGKINGIMAIGFDVSPQVIARQKIEESEQNIRTMVENAPFPIGVYAGKEMRVVLANQSIMDVWGKGNDVVGKLYRDILPELNNQAVFEQVNTVFTTGIPFHAKNQRVDLLKNGEIKPYYFNYSFTPLYDAEGKIYGVMNTAAEVTELHEAKQKVEESEKRFRDSVQQAPLAIAIFRGPDFMVEQANDAYLQIVDKQSHEFIGYSIFDALPEIKDQVAPLFSEVVTSGVPFYGNDFLLL